VAAGVSVDTITVRRLYWGKDRLHEKTAITVNGIRVERFGRRVHFLGNDWPAETARSVGTALIELAEAACAEPDPELLATLVETLDKSFDRYGANTRQLARDVLRAFKAEKRESD
jgi:hypothetical protein